MKLWKVCFSMFLDSWYSLNFWKFGELMMLVFCFIWYSWVKVVVCLLVLRVVEILWVVILVFGMIRLMMEDLFMFDWLIRMVFLLVKSGMKVVCVFFGWVLVEILCIG